VQNKTILVVHDIGNGMWADRQTKGRIVISF